MNISDFRFRAEQNGELVILQVACYEKTNYSFESSTKWRDAKVEDLLDLAELILRKGQTDKPKNPLEF